MKKTLIALLPIFLWVISIGAGFFIALNYHSTETNTTKEVNDIYDEYQSEKAQESSEWENEKCDVLYDINYDCSDFESQQNAQSMYQTSIECYKYDKFNLDTDQDGIACELLP